MRLAVIHHRHQEWVPALQEAEPRLEIRGWHPKELEAADGDWLAGAEGLFCWKLPEGLAPRMPRLAWVQNSGAGVDHLVHHPELPAHIPITRADGAFGFWMARYACGHLLAEAQRLAECAEAQSHRIWNPRLQPEDLTGQRAVVLGFGRIGRRIGRALRELGMEVAGVVRAPRQDPDFPLRGTAELAALLPSARALVLAAPLTPETRGLVDAKLLAHGHDRLTLINVGRGELVVVSDLVEALDAGRLGRAVLDVFPEEPLPAESPLWAHPKITVTPHHSGPSTPRQLIPDILPNLQAFAEGRPITGAVDRDMGY
ncbi:MAG TPA: D-2-hydroxyacid dehydrogenase [Holophagaceae bacterium]|nr:D-2-hydroxyacid dehydrogenase [Holophagaceae bacterium]